MFGLEVRMVLGDFGRRQFIKKGSAFGRLLTVLAKLEWEAAD